MEPKSTKGSWARSSIWSFLNLNILQSHNKGEKNKIFVKAIQQIHLVWFDVLWFDNFASRYFFSDNGSA